MSNRQQRRAGLVDTARMRTISRQLVSSAAHWADGDNVTSEVLTRFIMNDLNRLTPNDLRAVIREQSVFLATLLRHVNRVDDDITDLEEFATSLHDLQTLLKRTG